MPSKRSFFNKTLFKKHLSRFWPLWGGVSLVGAMLPLYLLLALMQHVGYITKPENFREGLYQIAVYFVPAFLCVYAILCVMAVWGYLYNARAVGLMHTLPVDRTCLFITNALSGLAMILIPFAVTGGLLCLIALAWGFFDVVAVANTILTVLFCALLFYGMGTLCAMLTGHAFVLPAFYLLANFLAFLMEILVVSLAREFLIGVPMMEDMGRLSFLSPIMKLYNSSFTVYAERLEDGSVIHHLRGLWIVALYALAGCAMLALSWFLYKRRHSERAGDVVAFRWMRPVFRYGVALLSGLTIGRLLYIFLWESLFQKGSYADVLPLFVCVALGGLLGFYAASMLLEKSRRVFRGSLLGAGIVCAGAAVLCLLVSVDVFGAERRVPEINEIKSVQLEDRGILSGPFDPEEDPEQVEAVRAFHQALVKDRNYIRSYQPDWDHDAGKAFSHYIWLTYELTDGTKLTRQYDLWFTEDRVKTAGTYDNLLEVFYQDPEVRRCDVTIPENADIRSIDVFSNYMVDGVHSINTNDRDPQDTKTLYTALQQDADEGSIPAKDVLVNYGSTRNTDALLCFNVEYRIPLNPWDGSWTYGYKDVYIHPQMKNTVEALIALGYLTEENASRWAEDYERDQPSGPRIETESVYW